MKKVMLYSSQIKIQPQNIQNNFQRIPIYRESILYFDILTPNNTTRYQRMIKCNELCPFSFLYDEQN